MAEEQAVEFSGGQRITLLICLGVTAFAWLARAGQVARREPVWPAGAVFQSAPLPPTITEEPYLRIHIAGAVQQPGVYALRATDRVIDAIAQAGGATPDARLNDLNLAANLIDGMRLTVPGKNDGPADKIIVVTEDIYLQPPPDPRPLDAPLAAPGPPEVIEAGHRTVGRKPSASGRKALPTAPVNINRASLEQLQQLPGVGPTTAARIIAWRGTQGRFAEPRDLLQVNGIGEATFAKMAPYVTVE